MSYQHRVENESLRHKLNAALKRAEEAEALNNHLELAVRSAEGVSDALRRKLEAEEAKLAEMEKQEAVADVVPWSHPNIPERTCDIELRNINLKPGPLFTRPAPALSLAEMVPGEMTWNEAHKLLNLAVCGEDRFAAFMMGANHNRKEILRNIEDKGI